MAELRDDPAALSDFELLEAIRHGSSAAFSELRRRHLHAFQTVAAGYRRADRDRDGTVDRAITRLGRLDPGPRSSGEVIVALFALLRGETAHSTETSAAPQGLVDLVSPAGNDDPRVGEAVTEAFGHLDERDKVLLWFHAVEGSFPTQLAERLSIRGADVASAMAQSSLHRFRQCYVQSRSAGSNSSPACTAMAPDLVTVAEGGSLGGHDTARTTHLDSCRHCSALLDELRTLPTLLLHEAAATIAAIAAGGTSDLTATVTESGPPAADGQPTIALTTFGGGIRSPHLDEDDDEYEDEPDRRRAWIVLALAGIAAALVIGVVVWSTMDNKPSEPVRAGDSTTVTLAPMTTAAPTTATATSDTTSESSSSTPSTSTTETPTTEDHAATAPPPTHHVPTTPAGPGETTLPVTTAPPATTAPATTTATTTPSSTSIGTPPTSP